ncbi:MAG: AAA family ATPase [Bryobacteraceae bacterium]|nr:AAA family ATPase [Bryobacteraceae bacterium]MDW8379566.1 AAA family ATPase [Bryobacterales bacterium]
MQRPRIVLLVGLPGSGKSTWAARQNLPVLSSDEIRRLLLDDPADQRANRRVFQILRFLLKQRLALRRALSCVDATHLTRAERRPYLALAEIYDCEVEAVFFDVPLEVCKDRNRSRSRVVPEDVLDRMAARLEPPTLEEGFTRLQVVREFPVSGKHS